MRLILMGRLKPASCTCMYVKTNPDNPDEHTGIAVAKSCSIHAHMLDGYMWHPAMQCECIIVKHRDGKVVKNTRKCSIHGTPAPQFPVTKTVMK